MTPAGKGGAARASRSGARVSYADRVAAGQRRLEVWLPAESLAKLDEIRERSGFSRPEQIAAMIDLDHESLIESLTTS